VANNAGQITQCEVMVRDSAADGFRHGTDSPASERAAVHTDLDVPRGRAFDSDEAAGLPIDRQGDFRQ
jgi:hypothetical protein